MRLFAQGLSIVFHPLLILTYGLIWIIAANPYIFGGISVKDELPLIAICFAYTFFLPMISILLLQSIGLVESLEMKNRAERLAPLIICIVFYSWFYINMQRNADIPRVVSVFALGSVIAISLAFVVSIYSKVSLHTAALGGLAGLVTQMYFYFGYQYVEIFGMGLHIRLILVILLLVTGLVASMRLFLRAHVQRDLYGGFLIGFAAQFIAMKFLF